MPTTKSKSDESPVKLNAYDKKTRPESRSSTSSMSNRLSHERMSDRASEEHSIDEAPVSDGEIFVEKKPYAHVKTSSKHNKEEQNVVTALRGIMKSSTNTKMKTHRTSSPPFRVSSPTKETSDRSSQTFITTNILSPRLSKEITGVVDSSIESEKRFLHVGDGSPTRSRSFSPTSGESKGCSVERSDIYILRKTFSQHLLLAEQTAAKLLLKGIFF